MRIGADRAELVATSDAIVDELVTPPADGPDVCSWCRTWLPSDRALDLAGVGPAGDECENCTEVRIALGTAPQELSVVSLYRKPSQLRDWLTRYKGRNDADDPFDSTHVAVVASLLGRYLLEHGDAVEEKAGGPFDAVVVVPSTDRPPPHPLESVVQSLELDIPVVQLLARSTGDLAFRRPTRDGYRLTGEYSANRVLLLDDVYTTGSRINSAAVELTAGGHNVGAALVIARRINPEYSVEAADLWRRASEQRYDWGSSPWT